MTAKKFNYMRAVAAGVLLVCALPAKAADKPETTPPAQQSGAGLEKRMKRISEELSLTDQQKDKVKAVFQEQTKKVRELRQEKDLSRADRQAKFKEIRDSVQTQLNGILSE